MWRNARDFEQSAKQELATVPKHLFWIVVLAVAIPLLAAIMLLFLGDNAMDMIRILAAALIFLGMAGLGVAIIASRVLSRVVAALTGAKA
jgi:hypothetical protein